MKRAILLAFAVLALSLPAHAGSLDDPRCKQALAAYTQWKTERCDDPLAALTLRVRAFTKKHYGGDISPEEMAYLMRNPPADQRADIEAIIKARKEWEASCTTAMQMAHDNAVGKACTPPPPAVPDDAKPPETRPPQ